MLLLRGALRTIATALETPASLSETIASIERALCGALHPARVRILNAGESSGGLGKEIPLRLDGHVVGSLCVQSVPRALEAEVEDILRLLAPPIAAAIAYRRRPERRGRDGLPANIDALCRIPNRRGFDEHMQEAWDRALAREAPLVMALVDVDFFKPYNDRYGHVGGDRCLQQVASLLIKRRNGDDGFAARYGGEEFALVFEETTLERAVAEMQQICDRLAALQIEHGGTTLGRGSISAGVAAVVPAPGRTVVELIADADRSLYGAKRFGRNRICAGAFVSKAPVVARLRARERTFVATDAPSFGREDDLARIVSALRHARMLTLVGPRGIGKSRLLTLVADQAASRFHRPVVYVESELLRSDMDPATALASACDLTLEAGGVLDTVTEFLADREAIVILDDVEAARAEIGLLCSHLCARTSGVSIVVAAHSPVGIPGERTIVVPPLDDEAAFQMLAFHSGVDPAAARSILRNLGGNPGSIEAAAAWIVQLGADAVIDRLKTVTAVLSDPAQVAPLFTPDPV